MYQREANHRGASRRRAIALATLAAAAVAVVVPAASPAAQAVTPPPISSAGAAPYLYYGFGNPPSATSVMKATGIKWFTLAFLLSDGSCAAKWDGERSLTGSDYTHIKEIRAAGGDVVPSFGGASGNKLGQKCSSASALASAYQKVVSLYGLRAIDVDIEEGEFASATSRQREVDALAIIEKNNPGIRTYITIGTNPSGPDSEGVDLVNRAAKAKLALDGWTLMPFDYGDHGRDMGKTTITAEEGLKAALKRAYGYSDSTAYTHMGISSMNGKDDDNNVVNIGDFNEMLSYATGHHLTRYTFWGVNRDRPCTGGADLDSCSGISQSAWDFTKVIAKFHP
jgi:chitinase